MAKTAQQNLIDDLYNVSREIEYYRSLPLAATKETTINAAGLHLMETIEQNPDANMSVLSERMGVTKGATSQNSLKMQKMGIIEKRMGPGRDTMLELTKKGRRAYNKYLKRRQELDEKIVSELGDFSEEDLQKAHLVLAKAIELLAKNHSEEKQE